MDRAASRSAERARIVVCTYHKSGTTLFHRILEPLAKQLGLRFAVLYGMVEKIDPAIDIALIGHSLMRPIRRPPFHCVRIIRDPRDILVSGYLYHLRTREGWCTNTNFDPTPPITWPRVDFSMQHRPEEWKQAWLTRLQGRSYQQNLRDRDLTQGLIFELEGYTASTLGAMRNWKPPVGAMDVRLEDIALSFDTTMRRIFLHLGLTEDECAIAVRIAAQHDVNRMDDAALARNSHIHSRQLSKWRDVLTPRVLQMIERRHGDLISMLGYEATPVTSVTSPATTSAPNAAPTERTTP